MDKRILQTYSTWAKENLENQIEVSLKALGINDEKNIKKAKKVGDVTTIEGDPTSYPADLYGKRENIINLIIRNGYKNVIEEFAYTWFNRFVALKFMEVHGFLSHGFRVLSDPAGGIEPEILKNLNLVKDDLRLDMALCNEYKQQGKIEELFRHVLIKQCNVLAGILPMLFSSDMGYLELLLPTNLLKGETVITRLNEIPESAFLEDVEIIGWMYQYYISAKKDAIFASKETITKDTLPAVTQLFTPDWIVRYMAQNSVGRLWIESYPNSALRSEMKYYVEDAEQAEEVQKTIDEIKYKNVNPEDIRIIEPCCGSGHILVYVFDLLCKMYEERGYQKRDIPTLILKNNLVGLDVDKRAAQLASFSLIMKARSVNNRFFNDQYYEAPHVYELQDSKLLRELDYRKQLKDLNLLNDEEIKLIHYLVDTFENGKTVGSLLKVKPIDFSCLDGALSKITKNVVSNLFNIEFLNAGVKRLKELSILARILSDKYDVMITNPPYVNSSKIEDSVKAYASSNYPISKYDMFSMFIEHAYDFTKKNGFTAFMTPYVWMFIKSYSDLRSQIINGKQIETLSQLEYSALEEAIVPLCTFITRNTAPYKDGTYFRLTEFRGGMAVQDKKFLEANADQECSYRYLADAHRFLRIPGNPIAYWVGDRVIENYSAKSVSNFVDCKSGIMAGDGKYILLWFEPKVSSIKFDCESYEDMGDYKWFPLNSGGDFRKWYGNYIKVVDLWNDGYNIRSNVKNYRLRDKEYYFKKGLTWGRITSADIAFRDVLSGTLFGDAGPIGFVNNKREYILGFLNSKVVKLLLNITNPTLNFQVHDIMDLPLRISDKNENKVERIVAENINASKNDWDSFEISWDFKIHPLVLSTREKNEALSTQFAKSRMEKLGLISWHYDRWVETCQSRFDTIKENEEELNRIFIDIYGLQDELTADVEDKDVTFRLADKERDIRSLISYLVGVAMGRFSLDMPGLVYAGGDWNASNYNTYQPDDDGIIPIYSGIGMEDGLTTILIRLIKHIYGEESYRQNIDFIAEALGKNNNESSEETLNRYLNDGFYADHLKIYQKRPIYWLFTSGKKAGFKCLIYMHRYNEDTLARINAKYFLPESTRKKNELDELNGRIAHAEGRDKLRLEKERQNLAAAYNEAIEYGQVLDHMANQYISIDLDDGVKVNYAKFQGVEIVTDGGSKVKKDLLAPLK